MESIKMKARSMNRDLLRVLGTCHHEAGHAITAVWFGFPIDCVTIKEDSDCYGGFIEPAPRAAGWQDAGFVKRHIVIFYAGIEAQRLFNPNLHEGEGYTDSIGAFQLAREHLTFPYGLDKLREEAKTIVARQWGAVTALASALLARERIKGSAVEKIVKPLLVGISEI